MYNSQHIFNFSKCMRKCHSFIIKQFYSSNECIKYIPVEVNVVNTGTYSFGAAYQKRSHVTDLNVTDR